MLAVNALEAVCNLLLGLTFASLFNACSESWLLIGAILALGFISSLILQKSGGGTPVRIVCALLPALGLLFARSVPEALPAAVVLVLYAALTISGRNGICYEDYKYWFGFPAVPVAVVFVTCFWQWPVRPAATVCAAAYLFLGVLVLRRKRMGAGAGPRLRTANFAELASAVVFAVLAGLLLYTVLKHSAKVLNTLLMPFGYLLSGIIFIFDRITGILKKRIPEDEPLIPEEQAESAVPEDEFAPDEILPAEPPNGTDYSRFDELAKVLLIILALAVLAYIVYRFCRMIRNVRTEKAGGAAAIEEGEGGPFSFSPLLRRKKRRRSLSNSEKIRRIYREYLSYVRTCGVEVARQTTSEDVLEAAGGLPAQCEAERLRELYIRARYDDSQDMSGAEAEEAKTLLAVIRERTGAAKAGGAGTGYGNNPALKSV